MAPVLPNKVGRATKQGCVDVYSNSKHWPCRFPQHGPGRKHERKIELTEWQKVSPDIRAIFGRACDALGIEWRPHNRFSLSWSGGTASRCSTRS